MLPQMASQTVTRLITVISHEHTICKHSQSHVHQSQPTGAYHFTCHFHILLFPLLLIFIFKVFPFSCTVPPIWGSLGFPLWHLPSSTKSESKLMHTQYCMFLWSPCSQAHQHQALCRWQLLLMFYWAVQWSCFARVNALSNLSCKKLRERSQHHFQDNFWVGIASHCV